MSKSVSLQTVLAVFLAVTLLTVAISAGQAQSASESPAFKITRLSGPLELDPQVGAELAQRGTTDVLVRLRPRADLSPALGMTDWHARGWYVYEALRAAARTQAPLIAYAQARGLTYQSFVVDNSLWLQDVTGADVVALARHRDVESIRANRILPLADGPRAPADDPEAWGWNLDTLDPSQNLYGVQAVQTWAQYGVRGEGVVVANIDTGVYYQHEALDRQYRGNTSGQVGGPYDHDYDWYLPTTGCPSPHEPCDNNGHGSGTMGLMVGETQDLSEQIGVAPGAKWIACKGCESSSCSEAALIACADWVLAPTQTDGTNPDPDMRPHVVNNAWGGQGCNTWFQPYVAAWRAAAIFPAFSTGGTVACMAIGSPGDYIEVFTPSAHREFGTNLYAGGPSCFATNPSCDPHTHQVKPNVNAPTFARTADNAQDSYYDLGGSSGAAPHAAGTAALVLSANPALLTQVEQVFTILEQSANHDVPLGSCGKPACAGTNDWPNYEYGWGYLDALAAVEMAGGGPTGYLSGTVVEAGSLADPGDPLPGITVTAKLSGGDAWQATTDGIGFYTMTLSIGTYTVTAEGGSYSPQTVYGVVIVSDTVTTQDFSLQPQGWLAGIVTSDRPGGPLEADVLIQATSGPTWTLTTDPDTGYYSQTLDQGGYTVTASAAGYLSETATLSVPAGLTATQDFELDLLAPWIAVEPAAVNATLDLGQSTTRTLWLSNAGWLPLDYAVATGGAPWLALSPLSGTVPAQSAAEISLRLDAGPSTEPGVYTSGLTVQHNDPLTGPIGVPLTLTVSGGADWGKLQGSVRGTGYCDAELYPLAAQILLQSGEGITRSLFSDPVTGYYYGWLVSDTYTLTASAAGHADGAALIRVSGGQTVTQDLDLRWLESCLDLAPRFFGPTLPAGERFTDTLVLSNTGAGELTWQLNEAISPPLWSEVGWVSLVPTSGLTPADDSVRVDVIFDTAGLDPGGCQTASLGLIHDDPGWDSPTLLPLTLCLESLTPSFYITKGVTPPQQYPGWPVTYTVLFGNAGGLAEEVWLTDVLPSAVEYAWSDPVGRYHPARHALGWGPLDLVGGGRITATIGVTLSRSVAPGTRLTNSVYLSHGQMAPLSAQAAHGVRGRPACQPVRGLSLTRVTSGSLFVGAEVRFQADVWPDEATLPYSYTVDFGDGSTPVSGSTGDDPYRFGHTFASAGVYTISTSIWNCGLTAPVATESLGVTVGSAGYAIYLPVVIKTD